MENIGTTDECVTISELVDPDYLIKVKEVEAVDDKFDSLYRKVTNNNEGEDSRMTEMVDKSNKTAVIIPFTRNQRLVDHELSESEIEGSQIEDTHVSNPDVVPKTPAIKLVNLRTVTPHFDHCFLLVIPKNEEYEETNDDDNLNSSPSGINHLEVTETQNETTTPTSKSSYKVKWPQAVTTSTPRYSIAGGWGPFEENEADPFLEIKATENSTQSTDTDTKMDSKVIQGKEEQTMATGNQLSLDSKYGSDKPSTALDSKTSTDAFANVKTVKFAQGTVFEPETDVKRVYIKPRRMLTPGRAKPQVCNNPRFQALIDQFETRPRKIEHNKQSDVNTPSLSDHSLHVRAIDFGENSGIEKVSHTNKPKDVNVDTPRSPFSAAFSSLTANITGRLSSVLHTIEEKSEIELKLMIKKKKVTIKTMTQQRESADDKKEIGIEKSTVENTQNYWSKVTNAVKNMLCGKQACQTPQRLMESLEFSASLTNKRKYEEVAEPDHSPPEHKRHKYTGRISGRPPLRRVACPLAKDEDELDIDHNKQWNKD
ncbi:uncharacterized protein [Battus philenor]|uniref:uncharacterized protein n=1 Tax=Battus philenor TaxID=42288 RepID=UPI0035CFA939